MSLHLNSARSQTYSYKASFDFPAHVQRWLLTLQRHQQLKHFISTVVKDIIYFASEKEVHALHIPTRRREKVATLSFKIQCLAAGYGWVCAGGPNGECAFIDEAQSHNENGDPSTSAEVDALLPLNLDPEGRSMPQEPSSRSSTAQRFSYRCPHIHNHEVGKQVVNAITVARLRDEFKHRGLQDEDVAVLSYV